MDRDESSIRECCCFFLDVRLVALARQIGLAGNRMTFDNVSEARRATDEPLTTWGGAMRDNLLITPLGDIGKRFSLVGVQQNDEIIDAVSRMKNYSVNASRLGMVFKRNGKQVIMPFPIRPQEYPATSDQLRVVTECEGIPAVGIPREAIFDDLHVSNPSLLLTLDTVRSRFHVLRWTVVIGDEMLTSSTAWLEPSDILHISTERVSFISGFEIIGKQTDFTPDDEGLIELGTVAFVDRLSISEIENDTVLMDVISRLPELLPCVKEERRLELGPIRGSLALIKKPEGPRLPGCLRFNGREYPVPYGKTWNNVKKMICEDAFDDHGIKLESKPWENLRGDDNRSLLTTVIRQLDGRLWSLRTK